MRNSEYINKDIHSIVVKSNRKPTDFEEVT